LCLWIPGSALTSRPGMTVMRYSSVTAVPLTDTIIMPSFLPSAP
jgi:hypothetical protein